MARIAARENIFILAAFRPVQNLPRAHNREGMIDRADQQHLIDSVEYTGVYCLVKIGLLEKLARVHLIALEKRATGEFHHQREHHLWVLNDEQRGAVTSNLRHATLFEKGTL